MGLSLFWFLEQVQLAEASGLGSSRTKRDKTKLSMGTPHLHIFEFEQVGETVDPLIALGPYKSIIGALVRDFILLKYKKWNGKEDNEWMVLESEKDAIWERLKEYFTFPPSYDV